MSKQGVKKMVPDLRFPEFRNDGAWISKPLSELLFEPKVRNTDLKYGKEQVLSVSGVHGCVNQIEHMGRSYAGASVANYHVVENSDVVYTKSPLKSSPYGIIKENKGPPGIVSTLYAVYKPNDTVCSTFLDQFFSRPYHLNSFLQPLVNKGAKNDMKVKNSYVLTGKIPVPPIKHEQQKIADCLSSLDKLISTHSKKHDALQSYKKGLMQMLFPTAGETVPVLRFPKFKNKEPWNKNIPFRSVFKRIKTKNEENNANVLTISAQQGLVSQLEYFNKSVSARDVTGYYLLHKGDFAYNKSYSQGYPMGAIKPLKYYDKGVVSTLYICFRSVKSKDIDFFEQYFDAGMLNGEIDKIAQEGARNHGLLNISVTQFFEEIELVLPCNDERDKITNCLSFVDNLIAAQAKKVKALKAHKMGLMQRLFPAVDVVDK